ncbi:MAG: agmatinase [Gemmatimonas sp.]|jgi:agmatinase|uniref:agmatinase n=1 Tax=Gemmatimonas sp. TaxID=1962908 RepID=UPI00391FC0C0|nr:agmatinase [Gemmatimonadota bacterium]
MSLPASQPASQLLQAGRPTLIGVPYDAGSSYLRGAADAPAHIREALRSPSANRWTEDLQHLEGDGDVADAGDLALAADASARVAIQHAIASLLAAGAAPLVLGGDHSITYPVLRAMAAAHGPLTVLHLDAHADLYDTFDGDRFSHACPFARIMEEGLARRLVQVGIRTLTGHQRAQADRFGVEIIDMRAWTAGTRPQVTGPMYLSVDLDVLDPACAPGVSHWEPGGLSTRDLLALIQSVGGPVVGADVVEFNPRRDPTGMTAMVAAKVVKELTAVMRRA